MKIHNPLKERIRRFYWLAQEKFHHFSNGEKMLKILHQLEMSQFAVLKRADIISGQ